MTEVITQSAGEAPAQPKGATDNIFEVMVPVALTALEVALTRLGHFDESEVSNFVGAAEAIAKRLFF